MIAVALDLGASGGKLLSGQIREGRLLVEEIHRFPNAPVLKNGNLVWDFDSIRSHVLDGLRKAARTGFDSFGVDSFCNDYGLLGSNGQLLSPVFMYRDNRTEGVLDWMEGIVSARDLYNRTGCQKARFNTLVQLASQSMKQDRVLDQAECMLFVPDLIHHWISGRRVSEYTIASVTQLFDVHTRLWNSETIQQFSLPKRIFPEVLPSASLIGKSKRQVNDLIGSNPFSIYTVGEHDTASAVAAVPNVEGPIAYISSGTWSLMGTETDEMITSDLAFHNNFANEGGIGGKNRFLKNIMGLWLEQECHRIFCQRGIKIGYEEMEQQAQNASPFRTIIDPDDPDFFESGNMIERIQKKSRQWGQPIPETVGEITRCIKESLALAYRYTLAQMEQLTGQTYPVIQIIGGGGRSAMLNQFASSAMNRLVRVGPYEAAAIGNLSVQFMACGEITDLHEAREIIRSSFEFENYLPEKNDAWEKAFERYQAIKASSKS